jgi:branched-chain amino acid transport system substrate-binding protein
MISLSFKKIAFRALFLLSSTFYAHADVTLGIAMPFTGANAIYGIQVKNGAQSAADFINKSGGILGQPIQIISADDASDPKQGVAVAHKLNLQNVRFVIGGYASSVALPASIIYEEGGALFLSNATHVQFTERGLWNVFRLLGRDEQQARVAADYLAQHFKGQHIAVVHDRTAYGKGLADEVSTSLRKNGISIALSETINPGEKDYSALVSRLKRANADVVFFGGYQGEAALIIRQMRDQGLKTILMGGDTLISKDFSAATGPAIEGTLMTFARDPSTNTQAADVIAQLRGAGITPEANVLYAYAAVQLLKSAAERAGSLDVHKVADILHSGEIFDTIVGPFSYDTKGDLVDPQFRIYRWSHDLQTGNFIYQPL